MYHYQPVLLLDTHELLFIAEAELYLALLL